MADKWLEAKDLVVSVGEKEILHGFDFALDKGETHVIMGPNGSGKSTFGNTLMGNPVYTIQSGSLRFDGQDLTALSVPERAKTGLFMSFQNPLEVPGISLENFMRTALEQRTGQRIKIWDFRKQVRATLASLGMNQSYAERDLNVGFSGGEKKKAEIVQLLTFRPCLAILDETDSGLDVDAVRTVSEGIRRFTEENPESARIIITHNAAILSALKVDRVHILVKGRIVCEGGPELIEEVSRDGFTRFEEAANNEVGPAQSGTDPAARPAEASV